MPTPIQTFTPIHSWVASSNVFNVTFSSIDQTYDHLVITGGFTRNLDGDFGGRSAQFQWNGVTTGYKNQYAAVNASSSTLGAAASSNDSSGPNAPSGNPNAQGGRPAWEFYIPYYSHTGFRKHVLQKKWIIDSNANSGGPMIIEDSLTPITGPLTSLYVFQQVDSWVTGDWMTIYGVKNA
jgi:hypothetical protein